MPEPITSSSTAAGFLMVGSVSAVTILAGLDGAALIGAFAGAAVFVLRSKDMAVIARALYFIVSMVAGYLTSPELMRLVAIHDRSVASLIAATLVVTILNKGLDWAGNINFADFMINLGSLLSRMRGPKNDD
ncbi:putative holin [Herbaspirillum sp. NPDC101396]|uniref:putative holin n=1 Tax=Herbaspirillum sp. NPDC101396 TaxID=3364005 RepID=UPI00383AF1CB